MRTGSNLFGHELLAGDSAFSPSSFATKIFATGVALEGYKGMSDPASNGGAGGTSPEDPPLWFLDPDALAATPYLYLIPVGVDSMRSPPLGDASVISNLESQRHYRSAAFQHRRVGAFLWTVLAILGFSIRAAVWYTQASGFPSGFFLHRIQF